MSDAHSPGEAPMTPLPCPFCGEPPRLMYEAISAWSLDCVNPSCTVNPGLRGYLHSPDAVAIWNERKSPVAYVAPDEIALLRIPHIGNDGDPVYPTEELAALADRLAAGASPRFDIQGAILTYAHMVKTKNTTIAAEILWSILTEWNRRASPSGTPRESPAPVTRCPLSKIEREFIASAVVKAIAEIEATSPDHAAGIALRTFRDTVLPRYEATIAALESGRESPADSGPTPDFDLGYRAGVAATEAWYAAKSHSGIPATPPSPHDNGGLRGLL